MVTSITIIRRIPGFYVAYAPEFDLGACGNCRDEALNNLTEEIRHFRAPTRKTGYEKE